MSTIHSSSVALGLQVGGERRHRERQHGQVHRVDQARQRDHRQADPLAPAGGVRDGSVLVGRCHADTVQRTPPALRSVGPIDLLDVHPRHQPAAQRVDVAHPPPATTRPSRVRTVCWTSTATRPSASVAIATGATRGSISAHWRAQ